MNWLFILMLIILILGALRGFRRGFLRVVFSLVAVIVLIGLVSWANPRINAAIQENTQMDEKVQAWCERYLEQNKTKLLSGSGIIGQSATGDEPVYAQTLGSGELTSGEPGAQYPYAVQKQYETPASAQAMAYYETKGNSVYAQSVGYDMDALRKYAKERGIDESTIKKYAASKGMTEEEAVREYARNHGVDEDQAAKAYEKMYGSGSSDDSSDESDSDSDSSLTGSLMPEILTQYLLGGGSAVSGMAERMTNLVLGGISFVLALLIGLIIIFVIERLLDGVNNIPVVGKVNRTAGVFAGAFEGLIVCWLILLVISLASSTPTGESLVELVQGNEFLSFLYEHNGLTMIWSMFFA